MSRIHEALRKAEQELLEVGDNGTSVAREAPPDRIEIPTTDEVRLAEDQVVPPAVSPSLLASVRPSAWQPGPEMLFFQADHHVPGAEQFRSLRTRLYHIRAKQPLKTILITSALPGEGKTFVAANLAQCLAQQHSRRVLLVDADLRAPRLHQFLRAPAHAGLVELLEGKATLADTLQRGSEANLFFLAGGHNAPNPAELAASGKIRGVLAQCAPLFDWIVLDSSPIVPVSDAAVIASDCDGVALVVECAGTPAEAAQYAQRELANARLLGVVLNRSAKSPGYGGYRYGGYYGSNGSSAPPRQGTV